MKNKVALKWISEKSKKQRLNITLIVIANVIFSLLSIAFALFIKEVIDGATSSDNDRLIFGAVGVSVIVVLQLIFRFFINGMTERVSAKLEIAYKTDIFSNVLSKKYEKISSYHSGELMNRLTSDVSVVADGVTSIVPILFSSVARLVCAVIALVLLDWIFAVAFSASGLLVFLSVVIIRGKLKSLHKDAQRTEGKVRSFMQECIENILAVKVFSVNSKIEKKSEQLQKENFDVKMRRKNYSVGGHAIHNFIFSAGYVFALIFGAVKILNKALTYGSLSAILQLVNNVQVPFASLSNVFPKYYSMIASAERLMEIENLEEEDTSTSCDRDKLYRELNSLNFENVTFYYDRDYVLDNTSLRINKGDLVALTGVSGTGKSTFMKLLLGIYAVNDGEIFADTKNGKVKLDVNTRPLFSYVPQQNLIFSGSIRDNITFIKTDATKEEIDTALKISCLKEVIASLPKGIDTVIGENGLGLSEGQIQRIAIARAVISKAPVLLLDEATSALDEGTEKQVLDNLKSLKDVTLLIVTHKKAALLVCNKVIELKKGKLIEKKGE